MFSVINACIVFVRGHILQWRPRNLLLFLLDISRSKLEASLDSKLHACIHFDSGISIIN